MPNPTQQQSDYLAGEIMAALGRPSSLRVLVIPCSVHSVDQVRTIEGKGEQPLTPELVDRILAEAWSGDYTVHPKTLTIDGTSITAGTPIDPPTLADLERTIAQLDQLRLPNLQTTGRPRDVYFREAFNRIFRDPGA